MHHLLQNQVVTVFEIPLFFLRKRPLFFYTGIAAFASAYSYLLAHYFLAWNDVQKDLFTALLAFSLLWALLFLISYKRNRVALTVEREQEKFQLFRQRIINEFGLNQQSNIFEKINLIQQFMQENFSNRGLLNTKILALTNNTLRLYIENLAIKKHLNDALRLQKSDETKKTYYKNEIMKNIEQNDAIVDKLDNFIKELVSKKNNDRLVNGILSEFEHSIELLQNIQPRR